MPVIQPPAGAPTIQLIFEGLLILEIDRRPRASNRMRHCKAHILDSAPGHTLEVSLQRWDGGSWQHLPPSPIPRTDLRKLFWLDVRSPSNPGVQVLGVQGEPAPVSPQISFEEAVDFEGPRLYGRRVAFDKSGVFSTFFVNSGDFFTGQLSNNSLHTRRGMVTDDSHGKVAVEIGAHITLPAGSEALFVNGSHKVVLTPGSTGQPNFYLINIKQTCPISEPPSDDAELYYPTVAGNEPPDSRFHFVHVKNNDKVAPHAICFTGTLGGGSGD